MADSTEKTIKKNIRVRAEQWERIERAAEGSALTANQLVMALAPRCSPHRPSHVT